jgi:hypothetical protein
MERNGMTAAKRGVYAFFLREGFLPAGKDMLPPLRRCRPATVIAEMSATLILSWDFKYNALYKVLHGVLALVYFDEKLPVYCTLHRPPETPADALRRIINTLYDLSRKAGLPFLQVRCVEERFLGEYESINGYDIQTIYRDVDSEYAYRTADFINMSGNINKDKRLRYNKCIRKTDVSFIPVTKANVGLCVDIQNKWCYGRNCKKCSSFFGCEKKALEAMMDIYDEGIHQGLLIYLGGVLGGYGIGELLNLKVAAVYFGKSLEDNCLFYIVYTMIKKYFSDAEYINLEADIGNPGLRMFKTHLGVYELWRKYICTYRKKEYDAL